MENLKKILIIRHEGGLGDEVVVSAIYRELKKAFPRLSISVLAIGSAAAFLKGNKYIDNLYALNFRHLRPHQRWPTMIYWGLKLAARRYDAVFDIGDCKQKNWILLRSLASRFKYRALQMRKYSIHASGKAGAFLEALGIARPDISYDMPLTEEALNKVSSFTQGAPYVVLNPSAGDANRSFNAKTIELILSSLGELETRQIIIPYFGVPPKINCGARLFHTASPSDLIALVYKSAFVITPETSVVHIADGFQKNIIAFYDKPDNLPWLPQTPNAVIIKTDKSGVNKFDMKDFEEAYKSLRQR